MSPYEGDLHAVERFIIIASLINAALFYAVTIFLFIIARHSRLNWALASQKIVWLAIIVLLVLPSVLTPPGILSIGLRLILWFLLALTTWFVLYEVYRINWPGPHRENLKLFGRRLRSLLQRRKG